jgi:hypothetical protein
MYSNSVHISPKQNQPLLPSPPSKLLSQQPLLPNPSSRAMQPLLPTPPSVAPTTAAADERYELAKKELIIKIMKAMADEDGGIFSQIPKDTLTELLVSLLNTNDLGLETIVALLATITAAATVHSPQQQQQDTHALSPTPQDADFRNIGGYATNGFSKSSPSGAVVEIEDLVEDGDYRFHMDLDKRQYDFARDDPDRDLIINGIVDDDFPYKLVIIDVEPSSLWHTMALTADALLDASFSSSTGANDQEIDPRIKYYSTRANLNNVANFQNSLILNEQQETLKQEQQQQQKQQQQAPPTSPNSSKNNTTSAALSTKPSKVADPRLLKNSASTNQNNAHSSSPKSESTDHHMSSQVSRNEATVTAGVTKNDLLALQTRQLSASSLLSSLPDINLPHDLQRSLNSYLNGAASKSSNEPSDASNGGNQQSTVKLSIADYKRKLQRPVTASSSNPNLAGMSSMNGSGMGESHNGSHRPVDNLSEVKAETAPGLPSYTFNLQAPQSLHELLKNFQS